MEEMVRALLTGQIRGRSAQAEHDAAMFRVRRVSYANRLRLVREAMNEDRLFAAHEMLDALILEMEAV